jgi:hypothetical protein|eukprot:CAMPEP_0174302398 /NCGR_PEP_ID=MMETSP0809-20121228/59606_1 /TAXON_ID=73025 ORGANISM="Eutreptiella gymnastica-like, Strain CCMP1594" /NCGR_SAMPLE_ID=MMETSP0809 /ASSEMBLY_ACC=CAM_ASM_000658 /LENGTH=53 /DNA_ID=CAMNT_0015408303 /DNA_START=1456 /DNA_END=1617 /DNA_ORIENTATION=+
MGHDAAPPRNSNFLDYHGNSESLLDASSQIVVERWGVVVLTEVFVSSQGSLGE